MKILYLVTKDDVGGAQKYVHDLAGNIDKERFEAKILTGGRGGVRFLSNSFWPYFLFINDLFALTELFFIFKKEKPDVVHLNSSKAGVLGAIAAKLAGVPKIIFTAHGWVFNPDNDLNLARRKFYIFLHKIAAFCQDKIINVSEYDKKLAIKHKIAPENKLITIHNGIDLENLKFLDRKTARKALITLINKKGLDLNGVWIGSVGRLVKEKSYEDFIKAASLVKDKSVKFFVIGSGEQKTKLEKLIKNYGLAERFFLIENIAPAAPYLKAFDTFILSSIKEGLPYTLLEAMAAELPVITTRVGGMTEIIDPPENKKRGIVMPPGEPEELTRAINYLIKDFNEASKFSKEAKLLVKDSLTLKKMVEKTERAYLD